MTTEEFLRSMESGAGVLERIRQSAYDIHESVNQKYGDIHPYGFHLDMVADAVKKYIPEVCQDKDDMLPVLFGAYYHDAIEDARLTYSDVLRVAGTFFDNEKAHLGAEISYALTNEKGRTRAERADERYYSLIRETPYAPLVKACDRLANVKYSSGFGTGMSHRMKAVYISEMPHFLESIRSEHAEADPRFDVPKALVSEMLSLLTD
jgi:hypothetical protein